MENNILTYLKWRHDLSFKQSSFNDIDALILARFSYMDLNDIINKPITIHDAYLEYVKTISKRQIYWELDPKLFELMANSIRFKDLLLSNYVNIQNKEVVEQFSCVSIYLNELRQIYISFRGTDNTLVGWKEDFAMTFEDTISSHFTAADYIEKIMKANPYKKIILGGHSKGGHLAIAGPTVLKKDRYLNRILKIYSFDGPGLSNKMLEYPNYAKIIPLITTFIPQSSIIGKMLGHKENIKIVKAEAFGPYQHDIYSWEIDNTNFIYLNETTIPSDIIDSAFENYVNNLSCEDRKKVVEAMFEILEASGSLTLKDMKKDFFSNAYKMFEKSRKLDDNSKDLIMKAIKVLSSSFTQETKEILNKYFEQNKINQQS